MQWVVLQLYIQHVPGSNLRQETDCLDGVFLGHSCEIHHTQSRPPPSISLLFTNPIIRRHTV